jgi:hypothetical protein
MFIGKQTGEQFALKVPQNSEIKNVLVAAPRWLAQSGTSVPHPIVSPANRRQQNYSQH